MLEPELYWHLRCNFIRFFGSNNASDPANLADEVFSRLIRILASDVEIRNLQAFAWRIAQNVLKEDRRRRQREKSLASKQASEPADRFVTEALSRDLDECLKCLSTKERSLIQAFHAIEGTKKAAEREALATKLGLSSVNALRIRASRIRRKLADCIEERKKRRDDMDTPRSSRKG